MMGGFGSDVGNVNFSIYKCSRKQSEGSPGGSGVKNRPASAGDTGRSLVREDPTCRGAVTPVCHSC